MFNIFQSWRNKRITVIQKSLSDIELISISSQLARLHIDTIREQQSTPLLPDTKLAIYSFELGANTNIVNRFYYSHKLDGLNRFRLVMCAILYHDLINNKINTETEWDLLMTEYSCAWTQRFEFFWKLGYQFEEELSETGSQYTASTFNIASQLIKQINQQTHILLANGLIEER